MMYVRGVPPTDLSVCRRSSVKQLVSCPSDRFLVGWAWGSSSSSVVVT